MKKKILFVYMGMFIGGSTTSLLSLLNEIDYDKYDVDLLLYRNGEELEKYLPKQVNLLPQAFIERPTWKKILYSVMNGSLIKAFLKNLSVNKTIRPSDQLMAYVCATLCRKIETRYDAAIGFLEGWSNVFTNYYINADKKINWIHIDYVKRGFFAEFDRECFKKADVIVTVAEDNLRIFNEQFPEYKGKTIYIENILTDILLKQRATEEIDFKAEGDFNILSVCRISLGHKGLDRGVKALKNLKDEGYSVKWYVLGDGPDREKLEGMIKENGLENEFILLGPTQNPYPYFKYFDIFALPSRFEGKPMAITEAQMLGLVPVVTEYASANEQIKNEKTGIVVENNDDAIYYGIKKVIDNPHLLESIRENLKKTNFSNGEVIQDIYKIL
ncbi:MAG: glycosyltransferase [Clostridia bacterium]|nr:glycosyltransferase [Clostridia bacterium]